MTSELTNILLLSLLGLNVFVLIALAVVAKHLSKQAVQSKIVKAAPVGLASAERQRLEEAARVKVEAEVEQMTKNLQKQLDEFVKDLKNVLLGEATTTLTSQLDNSKQLIAETVSNLNMTLSTAGAEAASQLKDDMQSQKHKLVEQFEQHMAAVISSYLVTALGTESAQSDQAAQAIKQLEAHKDELRKDLLDEA